LPAVITGLGESGISTLGSCGDVTRNVTGCPLAGVDGDEIADASPLVEATTAMLNGSPEFYNLPRKFKVSITGCRVGCSYPEINDVGLTALRHPDTGQLGFSVPGGGGGRALGGSVPPRASRRVRAVASGARRGKGCRGNFPRQRRTPAEPGEGPAQVPLPASRMDGGALPCRARDAPRAALRSGRA